MAKLDCREPGGAPRPRWRKGDRRITGRWHRRCSLHEVAIPRNTSIGAPASHRRRGDRRACSRQVADPRCGILAFRKSHVGDQESGDALDRAGAAFDEPAELVGADVRLTASAGDHRFDPVTSAKARSSHSGRISWTIGGRLALLILVEQREDAARDGSELAGIEEVLAFVPSPRAAKLAALIIDGRRRKDTLPSVCIPARPARPMRLWKSRTRIFSPPGGSIVTIRYLSGKLTPCARVEVQTTNLARPSFIACSIASRRPCGVSAWCAKMPSAAAWVALRAGAKMRFAQCADLLDLGGIRDASGRCERDARSKMSTARLQIFVTLSFQPQKIATLPLRRHAGRGTDRRRRRPSFRETPLGSAPACHGPAEDIGDDARHEEFALVRVRRASHIRAARVHPASWRTRCSWRSATALRRRQPPGVADQQAATSAALPITAEISTIWVSGERHASEVSSSSRSARAPCHRTDDPHRR